MRKGWRNFWIACGVTAGVGAVLCCVGVGMGATFDAVRARFPNGIGFVDHGGYESDYFEGAAVVTEEVFAGINKIDVEVTGVYLEVMESDDSSKVKMETTEIESRLKFRDYQEGDELKLVTNNKNILGINNGSYGKITLYLPRHMMEEIDISCGAGELYAESLQAKELSIDIGAGEGTINNFNATNVDINCGAGQITLNGCFEQDMEVECGIGEVQVSLDKAENYYNYDLECGIGEIRLGESIYSGISSERQIDNNAYREIRVECGIGEVRVDFNSHHDVHHEE